MSSITAIVTAYRRPNNIQPLVDAVRRQSVPPTAIWAWANGPNKKMKAVLAEAMLDRVVTSSQNAYFHGRFALALLAQTEFVAIFDDDTIPGENWFANCLNTMTTTPGILGTAGVVLHERGYARRTMHGWQRPSDKAVEVDLVGQAWFLRTEWVKHLFAAVPVTGTNGEDIELAARASRLAGVRSFCPPHPVGDLSRWGSTRGLELGLDEVAASLRVEHLAERKRIVESEISSGWQPLFMRGVRGHVDGRSTTEELGVRGQESENQGTGNRAQGVGNSAEAIPLSSYADVPPTAAPVVAQPPSAVSAPTGESFVYYDIKCGPRWITQYSYPLDETDQPRQPALVTLRIDGLDEEPTCCLECRHTIESLGGHASVSDEAQYDCIDCGAALERVRDPLSFLRRARRLVTPTGQLLASVANARRESVIRGLLEGTWRTEEPGVRSQESEKQSTGNRAQGRGASEDGASVGIGRSDVPPAGEQSIFNLQFSICNLQSSPPQSLPQPPREGRGEGSKLGNREQGTGNRFERSAPAPPLRFYTRRELEKLFYRAGFRVSDLSPSPTLPLSPSQLLAGFSESETAELQTDRYQITAEVQDLPDYGLTSIVIVTHNQLSYTHACLESVRFVTDEPYELIVVDNGSTDGTVDYLRSCPDVKLIENADNRGFPAAANQGIRASSGEQVLLLNNDVLVTTGWLRRMLEALGKAEGRRQKAEANPKSKIQNPKSVGLVGPLTNNASGYQEIAAGYSDLACLDGFAWERAKTHAGQVELVDRLIGFCLLIRREVIDQIGLLDERFGIGNYEDDDYCRRARDAGWRLAVAQDVYIHHFGHCTFQGAGVDLQALLDNNRQLYEQKWEKQGTGNRAQGTEEKSGARSQESEASAADAAPSSPISHPSSLPLLSLCMIVRNNAATIRPALESAKPWFDEMIVVDTGSTDETPDICRELGAKVYHFPWPDSFAIARNESLKYARGDWIFWMDSDDVIDADNGRKLRQLVVEEKSRKSNVASQTKENTGESGARRQESENQGTGNSTQRVPEGTGASEDDDASVGNGLRAVPSAADAALHLPPGEGRGEGGSIPPNDSTHRAYSSHHAPRDVNRDGLGRPSSANVLGFVMQVHCPGSGPDGADDVTVVDHLKLFRNRPDLRFEGRIHEQVLEAINRAGGEIAFTDIFVVHAGADHSTEGRKRKLKRDLKLLRLDRRERPNHTFVHFNLGMTYADAGKHRQAIKSLRRSLELAQPHESHVRKIYALLVASHRELGQKEEARQCCAEGLRLYPKDPELLFRQAMLMHEDGRLRAAELSYRAALANDDGLHFASIDRGIVGFKARQNLAVVYTEMGALHKAEAEWRQIVEEAPSYRDGWRGLVENLLAQKRPGQADEAARRLLVVQPRLRGLALALVARVAETAGQVATAREILERAAQECPDDAAPLDELCRVLFYQGELSEIEGALRELLRRQPDNAAAHHNLGTVLSRATRHAQAVDQFKASLRHRPDSPLTYLSLGHALRSAGLSSEARQAFEKCLRLAPAEPLAAEAQRQLAALAA